MYFPLALSFGGVLGRRKTVFGTTQDTGLTREMKTTRRPTDMVGILGIAYFGHPPQGYAVGQVWMVGIA